jgi:hypothetical protein
MAGSRRDEAQAAPSEARASRRARGASGAAGSTPRRSGRLAASRAAPAVASRREVVSADAPLASASRAPVASTPAPAREGAPGSRRERALQQRLYLLERRSASDFTVLGSTGNAYAVSLEPLPRCSCPDFRFHGRSKRCKHILFVLRVLGAPPGSAAAHAAARPIPPDELAALLAAPARHVADASPQLVARYAALAAGEAVPQLPPRPVDASTDICAICFEPLLEVDEAGGGGGETRAALVHCRLGCGRSVHAACFSRWAAAKRAAREELTCVYCRAPWEPTPAAEASRRRGTYINVLQDSPGAAKRARRS